MISCYMCEHLPIDRTTRYYRIYETFYDCSICGKNRNGRSYTSGCSSWKAFQCEDCVGKACVFCQYKPCARVVKDNLEYSSVYYDSRCAKCDNYYDVQSRNGPLTCRDLSYCEDCAKDISLCSECANPETCPTRSIKPKDRVVRATDRLSVAVQKKVYPLYEGIFNDHNLCPGCKVLMSAEVYHKHRMYWDADYKFWCENVCPIDYQTRRGKCRCLRDNRWDSCTAYITKIQEIRKEAHKELRDSLTRSSS